MYLLSSVSGSNALVLCMADSHVAIETGVCCAGDVQPDANLNETRVCTSCTDVAIGINEPQVRDIGNGAEVYFVPPLLIGFLATPLAQANPYRASVVGQSDFTASSSLPRLCTVVLLV